MNKGYWNGLPVDFRVVVITIGDEPEEIRLQCEAHLKGRKRYPWWIPFIGQERQVVEVNQKIVTFYLDNADGSGLHKVTVGRGSPSYGHRSIYPSQVLVEVPMAHWQEYDQELKKVIDDEIIEHWKAIDPEGYPQHLKDVQALLEAANRYKLRNDVNRNQN